MSGQPTPRTERSGRLHLIVNPVAGHGRAARQAQAVEDTLRTAGWQLRVTHTLSPAHAEQLALEAGPGGQRLGRAQVELPGEVTDGGRAQQPVVRCRAQRSPSLREQAGQAPQPCRAWTRSATAICCSRVAWSARGAYLPPP